MFNQDCKGNMRPVWRPRLKLRGAGFTLVELLVVITIIGILIGLTMPAIVQAIESARRTQCANNLRNIGLAAVQYESANRNYPMNWGQVGAVGTPTSNMGTTAVGVSWMTNLLPHIDQLPLWSQVQLDQAIGYQNLPAGYNNLAALSTPVATFLCPSDTQRGTVSNTMLGAGTFATTNYKACAGSNWVVSWNPATNSVGPPAVTWAVGRNNGNSDGVDHGNGVICRGGGTSSGGAPIPTANMQIRDGASNTFFAGEAVPAWCGWSLWFWFDGSTATCGLPVNLRIPGKIPESNSGNWQQCYSFMSRHRGGANFVMCDNSYAYINEQIDIAAYQAMATIDGNETGQ